MSANTLYPPHVERACDFLNEVMKPWQIKRNYALMASSEEIENADEHYCAANRVIDVIVQAKLDITFHTFQSRLR